MERVKTFKWIGTALVLTGILLTNLNIYPVNIVTSSCGYKLKKVESVERRLSVP